MWSSWTACCIACHEQGLNAHTPPHRWLLYKCKKAESGSEGDGQIKTDNATHLLTRMLTRSTPESTLTIRSPAPHTGPWFPFLHYNLGGCIGWCRTLIWQPFHGWWSTLAVIELGSGLFVMWFPKSTSICQSETSGAEVMRRCGVSISWSSVRGCATGIGGTGMAASKRDRISLYAALCCSIEFSSLRLSVHVLW